MLIKYPKMKYGLIDQKFFLIAFGRIFVLLWVWRGEVFGGLGVLGIRCASMMRGIFGWFSWKFRTRFGERFDRSAGWGLVEENRGLGS
jgi:hypothetical protein